MRRIAALCAAAGLVLAACSEQSKPAPTEPQTTAPAAPEQSLVLRCRANGPIVVQLAALLPPGPPDRLLGTGLAKFALIEAALLLRKTALAQSRALDLVAFLVATNNSGKLIGGRSADTEAKLSALIDALYCLVGLTPPQVPPGALGPGGGSGVVLNNSPVATTIVTGDQNSAVKVPSSTQLKDPNGNTVAATLITVEPITGQLDTPLDQYGRFFFLRSSPEVRFGTPVTVGICLDDNTPSEVLNRLRLAHNVPANFPDPKFGNIEILPLASTTGLGLNCAALGQRRSGFGMLRNLARALFLPAPLSATASLAGGGLGGTTRAFSPFGGVDRLLTVASNPPVSQSGLVGVPVSNPPSVSVKTRLGTPIPGIPVQFATTQGSGTVTPAAPATVTTGAPGTATATSWVLGLGANRVTATAVAPVSELTFSGPVNFDATGFAAPVSFGSQGYSYLVVAAPASAPTGWQTLAWPVSAAGWTQSAPAAFGSVLQGPSPNGCLDQSATNWPINSTILLRRDFLVPSGTTALSIAVRVDNDVQIFLNGVDVTSGIRTHEGCANLSPLGPFVVTANTPAGALLPGQVNKLAILAVDRGSESFIDVEITPTGP